VAHTHTHTHTDTKNKNTTQKNLEIKPIEYTTCKRKLHTKLSYYSHKSVMTQFFTSQKTPLSIMLDGAESR